MILKYKLTHLYIRSRGTYSETDIKVHVKSLNLRLLNLVLTYGRTRGNFMEILTSQQNLCYGNSYSL